MKRRPDEEAKRWWLQGLRDYDDAVFCKDGERFNLSCFLAQQSAEKALKAFLYLKGDGNRMSEAILLQNWQEWPLK
jgi:HEPN domain-containing protein